LEIVLQVGKLLFGKPRLAIAAFSVSRGFGLLPHFRALVCLEELHNIGPCPKLRFASLASRKDWFGEVTAPNKVMDR
jgi:hypothetical protein